MKRRFVLGLGLALPLAACSGELSTADPASPGGRRVYPLDARQADQVLAQAMLAVFPGMPISQVALPGQGYTVTMRLMLDSHQITAVAMPASGRAPDGRTVPAFTFQVMHAGTLPLTGGQRARDLLAAIDLRAATVAPALPAAA